MQTATTVIDDLIADGEDFDRLIRGLDDRQWALPTPAPGWTVTEQVGHVAFIFRIAGTAAADPDGFRAMTAKIGAGFDAAVNAALAEFVSGSPADVLGRWRSERDRAIDALAAVPADQMVPWLVNPLPPAVLACAGMMEMFGHGQDIADALGVTRERTDRVARVAWFSTLTRDFGYLARDLPVPQEQFRFELDAPSGAQLVFGPEDATQVVTGPAVDLCLLTTRRRHRDDLAVRASGAEAEAWLDIAQCYRGPAGEGRMPGQFAAAA